ncbi:MAG: carboxyl transferase domain-containing protein [Candidatus Nanopelagicales bacterium]
MANTGVGQVIAAVFDDQSFTAWAFPDVADPEIPETEESDSYRDSLHAARSATGHDESVVVGEATIAGQSVAVIISDFDFLAGSVGARAATTVVRAIDQARERGLPLFGSPASGGTRMQEGTPAFVQMIDVAAAVSRYRGGGNAFVVWLRHPTTGGVMATWGSLGSFTFGEPGALAGFLGPRVYQVLEGEPFPEGVQTTENLARCGVIDGVVELSDLRAQLRRVLVVVGSGTQRQSPPQSPRGEGVVEAPGGERNAEVWLNVESTRRPDRPGIAEVLQGAEQVTLLSGTGEGEASDAVVLALCQLNRHSVVLVGQDRQAQLDGAGLDATALRVARRGFALAAELQLPLVTVIDTAGAELSPAAEQGALAGEIARCLADLGQLSVPAVSVLLGMGCGGGALAFLPADRVLAAEHSWLSPLPLEGASVIRYRTADHAARMAELQRVGAADLKAAGIVDLLIAEQPDAADESAVFTARVVSAVADQLDALAGLSATQRRAAKQARYGGGSA